MLKKIAGIAMSALIAATAVGGTVGATVALPAQPSEPALSAAPAAAPAAEDEGAYLFVHFVGSEGYDEEQVYFSVSEDGYTWTTLNGKQPVFRSTVGEMGIRDPFIMQKQDGGYVIIATDLSIYNLSQQGVSNVWSYCQTDGSRNLVIWESEDLLDWGEPNLVEVAVDNAGCTWAPEAIWDPEVNQYMVFWASRTKDEGRQRVYRAYTPDFKEFSEPEVYIENDDSRIDTTIVEEDGIYYRFTKNEGGNEKWVYMEKSTSLSGPFKYVNSYTINGEPYYKTGQQDETPYEGPTAYKLNDGTGWNLLLDNYDYKPFHTDDLSSGKFESARAFNFGGLRFRHGSVLPITKAQYDALVAKWPLNAEDKTSGSLIYELDFEDDSVKPTTGSVEGTPTGITYVEGSKAGTKAAQFTGNAFIEIDGSTILAGKENLTISMTVKITDTSKTSWICFIAPNKNSVIDSSPTYIGNFFKDGKTIASERFLNGRSDDCYETDVQGNQWMTITAVYYKHSTQLFIDGQLVKGRSLTQSTALLPSILGNTPTIFLGKATWGSGEFSEMVLDDFRLYDYAMPDSEVASTFAPKA